MSNQQLFQQFWPGHDETTTPVELQTVLVPHEDFDFNCIGWSIGHDYNQDYFWPWNENGPWNWGDNPEEEWNRFLAWYLALGYETVPDDATFDPTRHYVALIGQPLGDYDSHEPTHAIRYDPDKGWTSKNGGGIMTQGPSPHSVTNVVGMSEYSEYGELVHLLVAPKHWGGHFLHAHDRSDLP